jgi:hypothetical protein
MPGHKPAHARKLHLALDSSTPNFFKPLSIIG